MSTPVSALPSVMQVKKAKLAATLPAMETQKQQFHPKPIVVNTDKKEEPKVEKKDEKAEELDLKQFAVEPEGKEESKVEKEELKVEPKTEVKVEKKEDEDEDSKRDWRWMYKSLEGNHQAIVAENRELRDKLVALETKFEVFSKKPEVKAEEPVLDLSPEEVEEYGSALPLLNKLLLKQRHDLEQTVIKPLQQEVTELKKNTTDVVARTAASEDGNFLQQVIMQVNKNTGLDFDKARNSPKWAEFVARPIGDYSDITIGQALWDAHKKRDLKKVVKVFEDFAKSQATNGAGDAYRAPSVSAAAGALPDDQEKKPVLKWSKRKEASDKFRKRQISNADYEKIKQLYHEAEAEGRIDFSK